MKLATWLGEMNVNNSRVILDGGEAVLRWRSVHGPLLYLRWVVYYERDTGFQACDTS